MALRNYQQELTVDTLYEVRAKGGTEQIAPSIEVIDGTANIYVSQTIPAADDDPTGMSIIENGADFVGTAKFDYLPNYLYIEEATTITSVVVSGIEAEEVVIA